MPRAHWMRFGKPTTTTIASTMPPENMRRGVGISTSVPPRIVVETVVVIQTALPLPSPTIQPSPTPPENTPLDSVLAPGETWKQEGIEVTIKDVRTHSDYDGKGVIFRVFLTNKKKSEINIGFSLDNNLQAVTNVGNQQRIISMALGTGGQQCPPFSRVVPSGGTVPLYCWDTLIAELDVGNPDITEVILTVSKVSSIKEAHWRIPILH